MNFMPLLNQCELEDELSPIDDLSFDKSTSFIYFEMNQIVPSKFNTLRTLFGNTIPHKHRASHSCSRLRYSVRKY